MNRMRVALVHKIVPVSVVAFLLLFTPLHLTAQEREPRAADQATIVWLTSLWNDLAAWLVSELVPTPPSPEQPSESRGENSCAIDPDGRCGS